MAALVFFQARQRCLLPRNHILRDLTHSFDTYEDKEVFRNFWFRRQHTLDLKCDVFADITFANRGFTLTPLQQVTRRYSATSTFQDCGDCWFGVNFLTVIRTISTVYKWRYVQTSQATLYSFLIKLVRTGPYALPVAVECSDGTRSVATPKLSLVLKMLQYLQSCK